MADDVAAGSAPRPVADRPVPSRAERARSSAYYTRFSFAYMLLIMLAVGGVGALVLVLLRPDVVRKPSWSKFVPTGSPVAMERQIATQVSSEYKASTSSKLVTVFPTPLQSTQFIQTDSGPVSVQVRVSSIAVRPNLTTGRQEASDYTFFDPDSTVAYELCGLGDSQQNCSVGSTSGPSPGKLLHREALELALYTLKYVPGTDAVLTYLPPPANPQAAPSAVLVARKDVKANLDRPLTRTLTPAKAFLGGGVPDATRVAELTRSRIYTADYQTLPGDNTEVLVLTPAITAG